MIFCPLLALALYVAPVTTSSLDSSAGLEDPAPCFKQYESKLNDLLKREEANAAFPAMPATAEHEYATAVPKFYQASFYKWESTRTRTVKVADREMTVPRPDRIGVGSLTFYHERIKDPVAHFTSTYRDLTPDEESKMREIMAREMEDKNLTGSQQKAGDALMTAVPREVKYENVEGIGDAASWDIKSSELIVLRGRVHFKIIADLSDDPSTNIAVARMLAMIVLSKCE